MPITFRCDHCRKEIRAADEATGKRGKCPFCQGSVYVPAPVKEDEILPLADLDEQEERRRQQEAQQLLEQEMELLVQAGKEPPSEPLSQKQQVEAQDLHHIVINYCLDMAAGNLDRAGHHAKELVGYGQAAREAVSDLITGKMIEPALDSIPARVLQGFLMQLQQELK